MLNKAIEIKELSIGYSQSKTDLVIQTGLNYDVNKGEFISLTGNNGSGKSTLLKTIAGLIKPINGTIIVNGINSQTLSSFRRFEIIAYMPTERPKAPFLSCQDIFETSLKYLYKKEEVRTRLKDLIIYFDAEKISEQLFATLSDGQKQKVLLISILARNTPIVLLDEALIYLDYTTKLKTMELLKNMCEIENKTVILISHELDLLEKYSRKNYELKNTEK